MRSTSLIAGLFSLALTGYVAVTTVPPAKGAAATSPASGTSHPIASHPLDFQPHHLTSVVAVAFRATV